MPEPRRSSLAIEAKFCCFDPNGASPQKVNPLIRKMHKALANFKLEDGYVKGYVVVIDEFEHWQKSPNLLLGSWKLRLEILDLNSDSGATGRFNVSNDLGFGKAITSLAFTKYQTIIKIVSNHDELGDLTVEGAKSELSDIKPGTASMSEQKFDFFERFSKSVSEYGLLARVLILEKELTRLGNDISLTEKAKNHLMEKTSTFINSLKQNMSQKEIEETVYLSASLDLIPSI